MNRADTISVYDFNQIALRKALADVNKDNSIVPATSIDLADSPFKIKSFINLPYRVLTFEWNGKVNDVMLAEDGILVAEVRAVFRECEFTDWFLQARRI